MLRLGISHVIIFFRKNKTIKTGHFIMSEGEERERREEYNKVEKRDGQ